MQVGDDLIAYLSVMPQPVALALGRVVRASGQVERLEACLKAAEVVARYLAVVGLASAAASREPGEPPPTVKHFCGNLSFGIFETAARASLATEWDHPVRSLFRECLRSTKKHKAAAGDKLASLIQLRNKLGHALTPADENRARVIFSEEDPIGGLIQLITGVNPILSLPLVVALNQEHRRGKFQARLAFYVGEGVPIPRNVFLDSGIFEWEAPYLCTEQGLVPLSPGLLFHPQADGRFGLYFIDGIEETSARYKSVTDNAIVDTGRTLSDLARWIALPFAVDPPVHPPCPMLEKVGAEDGRTLLGLLRGDPVPSVSSTGREPGSTGDGRSINGLASVLTVRDFETQASSVGLGSAFRDVTYFLLEQEHNLEVSDGAIRVTSSSEPNRVLLTAQLRPTPDLLLTIFPGAFQQDSDQNPLIHVLMPNQSADSALEVLRSLAVES